MKNLKDINVLVACEYSGIVRVAFARAGCYAISCDLLPSEQPGEHYQGNVFDIINDGFDLLIAHPPCTFLSYAGVHCWSKIDRVYERLEAAKFFMNLYSSDIPYICVENPRGIMTGLFRKPDMEVHPYYFGDYRMKRTCFWLKNLPKLIYSTENTLFESSTASIKPDKGVEHLWGSHERSRFFPSVASAMASQWLPYILENHV